MFLSVHPKLKQEVSAADQLCQILLNGIYPFDTSYTSVVQPCVVLMSHMLTDFMCIELVVPTKHNQLCFRVELMVISSFTTLDSS